MGKRTANAKSNTGEIVLSALKKLVQNTGWTARTIIKFIRMEYKISDPKMSRKVSRALKRGVRLGVLQMERGRYRLNHMSSLVRRISAREIRMRQRPKQCLLRLGSCTPCNSPRAQYFKRI